MKKWFSRLVIAVVVILVLIQFIPVDRENPAVTGEISAPPPVAESMKRSCYDCHSNETVWPWYSQVAPVSWLVARDVNEGREHLNFSVWTQYSLEDQEDLLGEIFKEVKKEKMPLPIYLPLHPEAKLSAEQRAILMNWSEEQKEFFSPQD